MPTGLARPCCSVQNNWVMPITVAGLRALAPGQPIPVVSPRVEMGSALHVMADPSHHHADGWATTVGSRLSPALRRRTTAWAWTSQAIRAAPFLGVPASATASDFESDVGRLREMPADRLAVQLLRPISRAGDLSHARRWSRARDAAVVRCVDTLLDRPADGVAEFIDFLAETWESWFKAEWNRVSPALRSSGRRLTREVSTTGSVATALASLDGSIMATQGDNGVTIAKVQSRRHDVSRRGLAVAASAFVWPHLYVGNVLGQPLLLIYPVSTGGRPDRVVPVPEVMSRAATLAHPARLEVARAIATEPRTAGEISALWGMDPTLVNRHLRALAASGLARPTRRGRFVQYGLDLDAVRGLGDELALLLLR
jgi:DNA-binding transcriptional ArsR family regulator